MRWFVDVSSVGKSAERQRYCVESDTWQRALSAARALREDSGPMTGFSIELLDDGFSAIDPVKRQRYAIRKAPDGEPLTEGNKPSIPPPASSKKGASPSSPPGKRSSTPAPAKVKRSEPPPAVSAVKQAPSSPPPAVSAVKQAPSSPPPPSVPGDRPPPSRSSRPPAPDLNLSPRGKSKTPPPPTAEVITTTVHAPVAPRPASVAPPAPAPPTHAAAPAPEEPELPPMLEVISQREQDPSPNAPLTYRERAFFAPGEPSRETAEKLLRVELERVRRALAVAPPGKLVNLAVFDVRFSGRPPKLPVATLTWKDWKEEPVVGFPVARASQVPVSRVPVLDLPPQAVPTATVRMSIDEVPLPEGPVPPVAQLADLDGAARPATAPPEATATASQPPLAPAVTPPAPVPEPEPVIEAPPPSKAPDSAAPPTTRAAASARPVARKRLRGDELIADLFEAMHDLQFLRDSIEGAEFCLTLALEKMPANGGIVHLYDINRREFVITCAGGAGGESLLTQRSAETDPVLAAAMRKRRPIVMADATLDESVRSSPRYVTLGGAKSLMVAPVAMGGRFLGAIELLNPVDEAPFTADDGHALSYIAEQLAQFISQRGIVLEREKSSPPPPVKTGRSASAR